MSVILKRPWTKQPQYPAPFETVGLARGLFVSIDADRHWARTYIPPSTGGTFPPLRGSPAGVGSYTFGATYDRRVLVDGPLTAASLWSFGVTLVPYGNEILSHLFGFGLAYSGSVLTTAPGEYRGVLNFNSNYYFWGDSADWDTGIAFDTDGREHTVLFVHDGTNIIFYRDGVQRASAARPGGITATPTGRYAVLGNRHSGGTNSPNAVLVSGRAWDRALSAGEAIQYTRRPNYVYAPLQRRIWAPASGAATHTTSGALASDAAAIAGTATHLTLHTSTGALSADAATVAGTAVHSTLHTTTGALSSAAATIAGTATLTPLAGTTHATSGALAADAAAVAGTAAHLTLHATTGALAADAATVAGTAAHLTLHTTSGALQADSATIAGTAQNGLFVPSTTQGAGRPSKDRKPRKRKILVEIDGEDFEVSSVEEAEEILDKTRAAAQEQADKVVERANAATNRPVRKVLADARKTLVAPSIKVPADIRPEADALRAEIESIYNAAIQAVEIGALLRKQAEQDEEEDILMLLL